MDPLGSDDIHKERLRERGSDSRRDVSVFGCEAKEAWLLDLCSRCQEVYQRVNNCFSTAFALNHCESLTFDVEEYRKRSMALLSHLPSSDEMQGMHQIFGLWSDLFQTEISMLCNPILLERNITIAKKMRHYILTRERPPASSRQKLVTSPALVKVQASALGTQDAGSMDAERYALNIVNQLVTFNERMHMESTEDRSYYETLCDELYFIKESELLNRSSLVESTRSKVLPFLKRLSRMFDMDKCTLNLSMLFFDFYLDSRLARGPTESCLDDSQVLCIGTACYLLACALREHWTDISCDSYLDRAAQMVSGAFTSRDIVVTQLDILQTMPKGFTSMYTATEYAIFFLTNIKGLYKPACDSLSMPNSVNSTSNGSQGSSAHGGDYGTIRTPLSASTPNSTGPSQKSAESSASSNNSREVVRRSPGSSVGNNFGRTNTVPIDGCDGTRRSSDELETMQALNDYLLLEMGFKYMVENGGFAFVYHCVMRWDDSYVSRNWNLFIPPSRVAAVLVFHFFVEFFGVDHRKDLVWCRRFCYKAFRMLYDCDVALWYHMFRDNIRKWVKNVAQSSIRLGEMALLLEVSGQKFRAAETCIQTFWSRLIFDYVHQGFELEGLEHAHLKNDLDAIYQLISQD